MLDLGRQERHVVGILGQQDGTGTRRALVPPRTALVRPKHAALAERFVAVVTAPVTTHGKGFFFALFHQQKTSKGELAQLSQRSIEISIVIGSIEKI